MIASIPRLQSALNFFMNGVPIRYINALPVYGAALIKYDLPGGWRQ
jgi:hypothetical protein